MPVPRKQNSSPLPEQTQRIYARGHAFSRSWNADEDEQRHGERQGTNASPQTKQPSHQKIQRAPPRPPPPLWLAAPRPVFQQARSVEALPQQHYLSLDQRSQSEQTKKALIRQSTPQIPQTMVSKQCQDLWHERRHLENKSVFRQISTDLSDDFADVASTSFESNTESLLRNEPRKTSHFLRPPTKMTNAEMKRQRYKNLLQHRNAKTTTGVPAESSFESGGSDSTTKFGSSLDSAEFGWNSRRFDKHRSPIKQQKPLNQALLPKHVPVRSLRRPLIQAYASYDLERDYSVDSKSDSLFRSFSRVDPWYEPRNDNRIQYPSTFDPSRRRRSPQLLHIMAQYRSADNPFYR
uniref:Uncharacterized protein n=1 Tax=Panagrolaimus sp. JU765 TaxID=591449 RepID=A0AC34QWA4_9BILA